MNKNESKVANRSLGHKLSYLFSVCVLTSLSGQTLANPSGAQVVNGSVQINAIANQLNIHNSPGAIINWQNFSIGQQEITRFIQQNGTSAVLNRVLGQNPSAIMGKLLSNGHVFLLNPNGVVFGANAVVDTAGLVASSLNMSDESFLSGKYQFSGDASHGAVINRGLITTGKGGEVVLIAPTVENHGVISVEGGNILLAAGEKMTLSSLDLQGIEFEVQAPANKVMNLGKLLANGGSVGVFAGSLSNTGVINANSVTQGKDGKLWLEASHQATVGGKLSAPDITIAGSDISLKGAEISASTAAGGGQVRIGGDYQGAALGPDVANAKTVTIDSKTTISANAQTQGDGGRVIVWSEENTVVNGHISATGGRQSGDGGFVETSGKKQLDFTTPVDVSATNGKAGTWLIDPEDITIDASKASSIETALNAGSNVDIKTSDTGEGEGNITVAAAITKTAGDDASLSLTAHNKIDVNAPITSTSNKLDVKLSAGKQVNINSAITSNGGNVSSVITGTAVTDPAPTDVTDTTADNTPTDTTTDTATTDTATATVSAETAAATTTDTTTADTTADTTTDTAATTVASTVDTTTDSTTAIEETVSVIETLADVTTSVSANGSIDTSGGDITIEGGETGTVAIEGTLDASDLSEGGVGGDIQITGDNVGLFGEAKVDASGDAGGGTILIGGDKQGENPDVQNATATYIGENTSVSADATGKGDGGKIIVFASDTARIYGSLSATGGAEAGNGGFVETSGKRSLNITTTPDITAAKGNAGTWLIDPEDDVHIVAGAGMMNNTGTDPFTTTGGGQSDIGVDLIVAALSGSALVEIVSSLGTSGLGDIYLDSGVTLDYNNTGNGTLRFTPASGSNVYIQGVIQDSVVGIGTADNINLDFNTSGGGDVDITGSISTGGVVGLGDITMSDATGTLFIGDGGNVGLLGTYDVAGTTALYTGSSGGGVLAILGNSTHSTITVSVGSTLSFSFGTHQFNAGSSITSYGTVRFSGGNTTFSAGSSYSSTGLTDVQGGNVSFNTGNTVSLDNLTLNNTFSTTGGLRGSDDIDIAGIFNWSGGTLGDSFSGATHTITANGGINITGSDAKYIGFQFSPDTVNLVNANGQAIDWSGDGSILFRTDGSLVNSAGSTFDITGNSKFFSFDSGVTASIENQGIININMPGQNLLLDPTVNNSGTINLLAGTLELRRGGSTHTGTSTFSASAGTTVNFTRGTHTFESGATVSTLDTVNISSTAEVIFNTVPQTILNLSMTGGSLGGSADFNLTNSFSWAGGTMRGSGTTTAMAGIFMTGSANKVLDDSRRLINDAGQTVTWGGDGAILLNGTSVFENMGNLNVVGTSNKVLGGTGTFENLATTNITMAAPTLIFDIQSNLTNAGTIFLNQGELWLSNNSAHVFGSGINVGANNLRLGDFGGSGVLHDFQFGTIFSISADPNQLTTITDGATVQYDTMGAVVFNNLLLTADASLIGSAGRNILETFTWESGTLGGNTSTVASGGILFSTAGTKTLGELPGSNTQLINSGGQTATWSGGDIFIQTDTGRFLNNGIFDITADGAVMSDSNGGLFDNQGATNVNLSTNADVVTISSKILQAGDLNITTGVLDFADNSTISSDIFLLSNDATMRFSGGTHSIGFGADILGAGVGLVEVNANGAGGQVVVDANFGFNIFAGAVDVIAGNAPGEDAIITVAENLVIVANDVRVLGGDGGEARIFHGTQLFMNLSNDLLLDAGDSGTGNHASIVGDNNQNIVVLNDIVLNGGDGGTDNDAVITTTGSQGIGANSDIFLNGGLGGSGNDAIFSTTGGSVMQNIGTVGVLSLTGGAGTNNRAEINSVSDQAIINSASITLLGGSGAGGGNFANITAAATQTITLGAGSVIDLTGGTIGTGNSAFLQASGQQDLIADTFTLLGGSSGFMNNAIIETLVVGFDQTITANNGMTLAGGAGGDDNSSVIQGFGNQTFITGAGGLSLTGGNNALSGAGNQASIKQNFSAGDGQTFTFTGGGNLSLMAGSGVDNNIALINNQGSLPQIFNMNGGNIFVAGGTTGTGNTASIDDFSNTQTFNMGGGAVNIIGGASGANNNGRIGASGDMTINLASAITLTDLNGLNNNVSYLTALGQLNATVPVLNMNGGVLTSAAGTLTAGTFNWNGGIQQGAGSTTVTTALNFGGGIVPSVLNGRTLTTPAALTTLAVNNTLVLQNNATLFGGSFTNQGTLDIYDAAIYNNFDNALNANVNILGVADYYGATFTQSGGTTTVDAGFSLFVDGPLTQTSGAIIVDGTLDVVGDLNQSGGTTNVNNGGILNAFTNFNLTGGTATVNTGGTLNVTNDYNQTAANTNVGGIVNVGNDFTLNSGTATVDPGGLLDVTNFYAMLAGATVIDGTLTTGGNYEQNGGATTVNGGGILSAGADYNMTAGSTTVNTGGTLNVTNDYNQTASTTTIGGSLTVGNNFNMNSGTTTVSAGGTLTVANIYNMILGATDVAGSMFTDFYNQSSGITTLMGGTINATTAVNLTGGSLVGEGAILTPDVNVGAAIIAPGFSPGSIYIGGNLTLTSASILNFEVGSTATNFDVLTVLNQMNFGGATFNLSWFGGYVPVPGDSYQLINFGSSIGSFGSVNSPVLLTSVYNPGNFTLSYLLATVPGPTLPGTQPPAALPIPYVPGLDSAIQLVVTMWEDAFSQWVNDPTDLNNSFFLTGAINGDNGDRDSEGRGQKIYISEWEPDEVLDGRAPQMCN